MKPVTSKIKNEEICKRVMGLIGGRLEHDGEAWADWV